MKYIKLFESSNISVVNKTILNDIDILNSLEDYLKSSGYECEFIVVVSSASYRPSHLPNNDLSMTLIEFKDYIDKNINNEIPNIKYLVRASIENGADEDLDEELESFTKRLESMTKCRIDSSNVYTNANKGYYHGHGWIKSCKITLGILALNLSKDRYKL